MIQVRKVQPGDIALLMQNADKVAFDKIYMLDKLDDIMLAMNGSSICGIGCGITVEDKCLLNWIFIAEEFRRDRMGTALVKTILNNAELKGAKTAYLNANCDEFASSLKFDKVEAAYEIKEIEKLYESTFGSSSQHSFYKASLSDYFKPCTCK